MTGNAFYVRVFINWEKATSTISGHSGFIVGSVGRDNNGTEVRLGISSKGPNGTPRMDLNLQSPSDGLGGETTRYSNGFTDGGNPSDFPAPASSSRPTPGPASRRSSTARRRARSFASGSTTREIAEMHVTDFRANTSSGTPRTHWAPTYNFIKIGAQDYDANLGHIWYDDVVVATQRVGCSYVVP